ncbi:hypothetical protein D1872_167940 [compost metagenome]
MRNRKRITLWILAPLLLVIGVVIYTAASIYFYGKKSEDMQTADAAIVLGAAVWNKRPSPVFRERIRHAITLYKQGKVKYIIFTGGRGRPNALPESTVARRYALDQGVPVDAILTEEQSRVTEENLVYAKRVAKEHKMQTFLIVSDPLHMKRAVRMARDLGIQAEPSPTTTSRYTGIRSQLTFLSRETFYYIGYCFVYIIR